MVSPAMALSRAAQRLTALFGRGIVVTIVLILLAALVIGAGIFAFVNSAAPTSLTLSSGPPNSTFARNAERYKKILAREGVTLKILPSEGSVQNLQRLGDPKVQVDVGFVLGGETGNVNIDELMSLGSISYQPLMVFYRGAPRNLLSDFKGLRLDIDDEGSGANVLARALLKANGFKEGDGTVYVNSAKGDLIKAFNENRIDAAFVMGDSTSTDQIRALLRTPDIHLFHFIQAEAYARRIVYLNKLSIPKGGLDFGQNLPAEDISLVGPTVELVARSSLHPALSDVLLEAAKEVHGTPGLFRKRGEFPAPIGHEFRISPDAARYYTSGKSFLYRTFPFWVASLIARTLAIVVPLALLLIPALKMAPAIYRWRIESRINRWYRVLLELEREVADTSRDPKTREELLRQLDHIEAAVHKIVVPAAFGDIFYGLRGHIGFVRDSLLAKQGAAAQERLIA
jgi:TRAP-type uncharacterized transport system substrate-binding protein